MVNFTCQFEQQVARCLVKYYFWVYLWGFSWMRLMYIHNKELAHGAVVMEAVVFVVFQLPSCVWLFATQWTAACQPPCPSPSPSVCPSSCSLYQWCHPAISSSDALFSFCPQSFTASRTFPTSHLFTSDDYNTSASASVLPVNIQGWWSPCCPRDFQESSPEPQFEGINSLAFCLLYDPALTTVHDHREDHSLDYIKAMTNLDSVLKSRDIAPYRQKSIWSIWRLRRPQICWQVVDTGELMAWVPVWAWVQGQEKTSKPARAEYVLS